MSTTTATNHDEWVEIQQPSSKERIYANLKYGLCAKQPPPGAHVKRVEDYSDHWWELYDQKTGKLYYYNPEKQKTVWRRPDELTDSKEDPSSQNGKQLLIIPVTKLQTFKKLPQPSVEKCDASTQTQSYNSVSVYTQTWAHDQSVSDNNHLQHRSSISSDIRSKISSLTDSFSQAKIGHKSYNPDVNNHASLLSSSSSRKYPNSSEQASHQYNFHNKSQKQQQPPVDSNQNYRNSSQLKNALKAPNNSAPEASKPKNVAANLSHYLIREAQAMGVAVISDEEFEDDDEDDDDDLVSDDDYAGEDDESDFKDDSSSQQETVNNSHASQDLAGSQEGWKSFSDNESTPDTIDVQSLSGHPSLPPPVPLLSSLRGHNGNSRQQQQPPPPSYDQPLSLFHLLESDNNGSPMQGLSQQLNHQKLVENFKKTRQTSSFGQGTRSFKPENILGSHKHASSSSSSKKNNKQQLPHRYDYNASSTERHMRQVSTLSTLPRPYKGARGNVAAVSALSRPVGNELDNDANSALDADYDVVEENCGYYSDSENLKDQLLIGSNKGGGAGSNNTTNSSGNHNHGHNKTFDKTSADNSFNDLASNESVSRFAASSSLFNREKVSRGSTFSVESFARENLARHPRKSRLLFSRKVKWSRMIKWTKNSIKQPMIATVGSDLNSDAVSSFKLIQQFMGDRKITMTKKLRQALAASEENQLKLQSQSKQSSVSSLHIGSGLGPTTSSINIPDKLRDETAFELVVKGCTKSALRDEIYVQLARQLTENPDNQSVEWGLVLVSLLLAYFAPSSKFVPFLLSFLENHSHPIATDVCLARLEKRLRQNSALTYCRKPTDAREVSIVRLSITKWPQYCGVFGESLERIMQLQACSPYLKTLRLPWILTALSKKLLETGGAETEGVFRCAADYDLIAQLRLEIDCVDFRKIVQASQVNSLLSNVQDPHVIAGLLKLFFRQLPDPVFPMHLYDACLASSNEPAAACRLFDEALPALNKDVIAHLIRLLQELAKPANVIQTKMDDSNLSMVWAPNLLKSPEDFSRLMHDSLGGSYWSISGICGSVGGGVANGSSSVVTDSSPASDQASQSRIFEQTRQEMQFIRALIVGADTAFIENVV